MHKFFKILLSIIRVLSFILVHLVLFCVEAIADTDFDAEIRKGQREADEANYYATHDPALTPNPFPDD